MLELPEKIKINTINRYGEEGQKWLENIDTLIEKYKSRFHLENLELAKSSNVNIVLFATSQLYGDVVMKMIAPEPSGINEIHIMQQYPSDCVPKCYYTSTTDRFMLLERIFPGYSLNHLNNLEERVKIFSQLANHLLIPASGTENFLSFDELVKKRTKYAYENKPLFSDILWMIDKANDLYDKIKAMHLPKYILHDDLHHKNILKSKNGWKVIDPHGIIGEKVIETAQFIRSELESVDLTENKMDEIITLVSDYFKEDKQLILENLYVYNIFSKIIWFIKNNANTETVSYNIEVCKKILEILEK